MGDEPNGDLQRLKAWLSAEVEFRIARKWLVLGGIVLVALLLVALD